MSTITIEIADGFWEAFLRAHPIPDSDEDGRPDMTQDDWVKRRILLDLREQFALGERLLARDAEQAAAEEAARQERERREQEERDLVR